MIRGTLSESSLPELIRFVSESHKTGVLEITGPLGTGQLLFLDGCVCGSRTASAREPLGRKLVRLEAVSEPDLWRALDDQTRNHQRLGQILIAQGSTSLEQVQSALREQIEDGGVDILALQPTEFVWSPAPPDEQGPVLISPDSFLSAVTERVREIERIRTRIPATDAILSINPSPPTDKSILAISREEWRMLALMGSRRTVEELMQYSGSGGIHTLRALDRLTTEGLLELGAPAAQAAGRTPLHGSVARSQRNRKSPRGEQNMNHVIRLSEESLRGADTEPFKVAIVATSNRPQALVGAAILRKAVEGLPVHIILLRLDDLGPVAPSAEALLHAEELGVDPTSHPSRQLRRGELTETDLVVGLDWWHVDRAVLYGGAARANAFTIDELLDLLPQIPDIGEARLVARARALVKGAHEKWTASHGDAGSRHAVTREADDWDDSAAVAWPLLAELLFSVDTVVEPS